MFCLRELDCICVDAHVAAPLSILSAVTPVLTVQAVTLLPVGLPLPLALEMWALHVGSV
jgi:hypothetical protein